MSNNSTNQPHILIVDDEPSVSELLFELLSERYVCDTSASAEAALEKLRRREFAVLISDIDMPGGSGLELASKTNAISPNTLVVLTSGNAAAGYAEKASAAGAFAYVEKPFNLSDLESVVLEAVAQHRKVIEKKQREAGGDLHADRSLRRTTVRDYQAFGNAQLTVAKCH